MSGDYYILNLLGSIDRIDMEESDFVESAFFPAQISDIDELVVNDLSLPEGKKVFRASTKMDQIFISDEVKTAFEEASIKGYNVFEAEGWDGLDV